MLQWQSSKAQYWSATFNGVPSGGEKLLEKRGRAFHEKRQNRRQTDPLWGGQT